MAGASNSDRRLSGHTRLDSVGGDDGMGHMSTPKGTECMGCGIMVGDDYMEKQLYHVGDYQICGWCRRQLEKRGRLQTQPYKECRYLYPDGRVVIKKSTLRGDEDEDEAERKQVAG